MPTRPPAQPLPASSSSSSLARHHHHPAPNPEKRLYPLFANMTFYVVPAKLEADLQTMYDCIDELGGRCTRIEEAGLVVSAVRGRPRLIRSLGREWIDQKPIVTPAFIQDTYTLALKYLTDPNSDPHRPPSLASREGYLISPGPRPIIPLRMVIPRMTLLKRSASPLTPATPAGGEADREDIKPVKRRRLLNQQQYVVGAESHRDMSLEPDLADINAGVDGLDGHEYEYGHEYVYDHGVQKEDQEAETRFGIGDLEVFDEDVRFEDIPALCVHRASPLICVNQDIIDAIRPIIEEREFEEAQQKNSNVLSYRRSLSVRSPVPRRIKSGKEARKLLGVGEKVAQRIDEYLSTGAVRESDQILLSSRYQALKLFASVYTIGHHKSKELYDRHHCRTLEDVRMHFEAIEEESPEARLKDKLRRRRRGGMKQVEIVEEWIRLKNELDEKIPRSEVEEIARCVMEHLDAYVPGCEYTICGGYRRGKTESNDVDVVFRPPGMDLDIGLLKNLYLRLSDLGIVTHVLHVTHRDADTPIHASAQNFDNLDKAFVIFKLPGPGRLHRRVDLISAPYDRYASAVLSWSGSMMFERDLKRYAENYRGYKFRAGLIKISTGEEVNLETEREIFGFLGLRYVPPELRNAD
ncbi:DNA polymerase mu subunit [Kwoniella heveanensis BCC8398]|uniref:DNA polymerase n=1 Tax=Kwoniella heveanensis BCC8398 TaxID=1296120 RepID=A0A1B9GPF0_9TREE|nr:DNA polymerase mu subunit [Kwoniella heveanensis BCC8398]